MKRLRSSSPNRRWALWANERISRNPLTELPKPERIGEERAVRSSPYTLPENIAMVGRICVVTFICLCLGACAKAGYKPRDGDIIFQTSRSAQSVAIQLATKSRWSHVGIVYLRHGKPFVLEAIQPVKWTPLSSWIARGEGHHFVAKRLRNARTVLTPRILSKMENVGRHFLGRNYDPYFGWSDKRLYCSELVWKVYFRGAGIRLSPTEPMKDFDLTDPRVRKIMRERFGKHPPLNERVVSPSEIFSSKRLVTVYAH